MCLEFERSSTRQEGVHDKQHPLPRKKNFTNARKIEFRSLADYWLYIELSSLEYGK